MPAERIGEVSRIDHPAEVSAICDQYRGLLLIMFAVRGLVSFSGEHFYNGHDGKMRCNCHNEKWENSPF
jgi:hypothetical protein